MSQATKDCISLNLTREQAQDLLAAVQFAAPHMMPVLQAVANRQIALVQVERGGHFPPFLNGTNKNILAIIGDDDGTPSGPAAFPGARRFARWARCAVLHATGADPEHYREAVRATLGTGRCLFGRNDANPRRGVARHARQRGTHPNPAHPRDRRPAPAGTPAGGSPMTAGDPPDEIVPPEGYIPEDEEPPLPPHSTDSQPWFFNQEAFLHRHRAHLEEEAAKAAANGADRDGQKPPKFVLRDFASLKLTTTVPPCIVAGLIPREAIIVFWGAPKSGKSFVVLDLSMHILAGITAAAVSSKGPSSMSPPKACSACMPVSRRSAKGN
jgi:hypothetical protein